MAESDILVNFDIAPINSAAFSSPVTGIRGGRWKDRFKAKKRLQNKRNKSTSVNSVKITPRPRTNGSASHTSDDVKALEKPSATAANLGGVGRTGRSLENDDQYGRDRPVISSIFSSNPVIQSKANQAETAYNAPIALPTNAPLSDGSEFATMGLVPTLASHLVTKMSLKSPTSIQQTAIPQLISTDSDAFIQAETGSGKTLTYLLPVVNRIITCSLEGDKLHRDSGCFAIILAPTRELGRQIHSVLVQLLSHPSLHWLVPILILGGEKKKSEKARIRKGGNIIVATPGRLADHLANTTSLDVGFVKWLVLDEGDRLMELGFEETLQQILGTLNAKARTDAPKSLSSPQAGLPERRITILCSATMKPSVQKLGDMSLKDALFLKGEQKDKEGDAGSADGGYKAPAQLKQAYIVAPAKLRLVSLAGILRRAFVRKKENMKVIVFFSCADSVDFHYEVFGLTDDTAAPEGHTLSSSEDSSSDSDASPPKERAPVEKKRPSIVAKSKAPSIDTAVSLFKLHGSLPQQVRTATLNDFFREKAAAVLFCTDVASRGLDLPNVDLVVQYDPPYSQEDYIHRIGRTARAGRDGRAMLFLLPGCEEEYPNRIRGGERLTRTLAEDVLKKGFGNASSSAIKTKGTVDQAWKKEFMPKTSGQKWEQEAIEFHLDIERRVLDSKEFSILAKRAFQSHVRAYATHIAAERDIFDIKQLHLGHLAKSFGLRDRPGDIKVPSRGKSSASTPISRSDQMHKKRGFTSFESDDEHTDALQREQDEEERQRTSQRMRKKMKEHMNVAAEFNIG